MAGGLAAHRGYAGRCEVASKSDPAQEAALRRWSETATTAVLAALAAAPFVVLFPEPPAFGRRGAGIVMAVLILAMVGATFRAAQRRRRRFLASAALLLGITVGATTTCVLPAPNITAKVPTLDLLPGLFGLQGEDVDDAVLYEIWVELWLLCALFAALLLLLHRAISRCRAHPAPPAPPWDVMIPQRKAAPPWNAATVLLWLVGWVVLAGAALDGHWTAEFLSRADHVTGSIVDPQPHPASVSPPWKAGLSSSRRTAP